MVLAVRRSKLHCLSMWSNPVSNKDILYYHFSKSLPCPIHPSLCLKHPQTCPLQVLQKLCLSDSGPSLTHLVSGRARARTCVEHRLWIQAECHRSPGSGHLLASGHSRSDLKRKNCPFIFCSSKQFRWFLSPRNLILIGQIAGE